MNRCPRVYRPCPHVLRRSHACVGTANRAPTTVTTAGVRAAAPHAGTALPRPADHARPAQRTARRHARRSPLRHRDGPSAAWRRGQTCAASGTGLHRGVRPPGCLTQDSHHIPSEPIPPQPMKRSTGTGHPRMIDPVQSAAVETGGRCASASRMMSSVPQGPGRCLSCGADPGMAALGTRSINAQMWSSRSWSSRLTGPCPSWVFSSSPSLVSVARWAFGRLDRPMIVE
jgi:hypothetical protein